MPKKTKKIYNPILKTKTFSRKYFFIFAAITAGVGILVILSSLASGLLWSSDFEDQSLNHWKVIQRAKPENIQVVPVSQIPTPKPYGNSKYAAKFSINDLDETQASIGRTFDRSELGSADYSGAPDGQKGRDLYYGWSVYFPNDYPRQKGYQLFVQWKGGEPRDPKTGKFIPHSPPLGMEVDDDMMYIRKSGPSGGVRRLWETPLERGKWHYFVAHIKWSNKDDGFVELWRNGQKIVTKDGCQPGSMGCGAKVLTLHTDPYTGKSLNTAVKAGLYRYKPISVSQTLYQDDWKIGTDYASVDPTGLGKGPIVVEPQPTPTPKPPENTPSSDNKLPGIKSLTLINADTDKAVQELTNGSVIDVSQSGTYHYNLEAKLLNAKSIRFELDTSLNRLESSEPYSMAGDDGGNFLPWEMILGKHTLKATAFSEKDGKGIKGATAVYEFSFVGSSTDPRITQLDLINADSDKVIRELVDGLIINQSKVNTLNFNVEAKTTNAKSVRFILNNGEIDRTESSAPLTMAGDTKGDYLPWKSVIGNHSLTVIPYSEAGAQGKAGAAKVINFTIAQ